MKYKSIELGREFDTKDQLFDALKKSANDIIAIKKKQIVKSMDKGSSVICRPLDVSKIQGTVKGIELDENYYYIVVNTAKILDSHKDLHLMPVWNKSAKEQSGRNYLVDTHVLSLKTTIAKKEYIKIFVAEIPFSAIGKSYKGTTNALIYQVQKDKIIDTKAKEWLDSGDAIEASVSMQYVDLVLAMNSDRKEDKSERKNYDEYKSDIANIEDFEDEIYYFWAVKEAKNVNESSLVLFGSNPTTGQLIDAGKSTSETVEPSNDTRKNLLLNYLNN